MNQTSTQFTSVSDPGRRVEELRAWFAGVPQPGLILDGNPALTHWERGTTRPRRVVVMMDEPAPGMEPGGAFPLLDAVAARKRVVWDVYLSGGQLEWFPGKDCAVDGGDLTMEDFRAHGNADFYRYTAYARRFVESFGGRLDSFEPDDSLVVGEAFTSDGGAEVLTDGIGHWAVYLPNASASDALLWLAGPPQPLTWRYYDPRSGEWEAPVPFTSVAGWNPIPPPPFSAAS